MSGARLRPPGYVLLAIVCVAAMGVMSIMTSAVVFGVKAIIAEATLLANEDLGWIMGGTGNPDPGVPYTTDVENLYLSQFPGYQNFIGLHTPEEFCPIVCFPAPADDPSSWSTMTFGTSVATGVGILNNALAGNDYEGTVFGYSQSATVATQEMDNLVANPPTGADLSNLHFTLVGDPNSPIGGILDRFQFPDGIKAFSLEPVPQHLPFLNVPLSIPPTPTDTFPTDIYTGEYDGFANFPQDQLNILGDINAIIGMQTVHPFYPDFTPDQLASAIDVGTIGDTNFYDIPENLPILAFMYDGGPVGQFFGDAFSPILRFLIDWGYGNAGDPAVDGNYTIPLGGGNADGGPDGSPYEAVHGVAGGPWAETPLGTLWDGSTDPSTATPSEVASSGVAGLLEKVDPLQLFAGLENAGIQTFVGPFTDILADINNGTLSTGDIDIMNGITNFLQHITGYDLVNFLDQGLLTAWSDLTANLPALGPDAILDGPLIPGQPLIDLVGLGFDLFNFFGA
jgi:hypothetical protein